MNVKIVLVVALLTNLRALLAPFLGLGQRIHARRATFLFVVMVGDVLGNGADLKERSTSEISHWEDDMTNVNRILRDVARAKVIHGGAELRRSGGGFKLTADRVKTKIRATHQDRRHIGMLGRSDTAIRAAVGTGSVCRA